MASSLIRGKYVVCRVDGRADAQVVEDGAIFQRDGVIVEIGKWEDLAAKYRADEVLGSAEHVVLPGFVNSHHHVGLTPLQLGSPDFPLELWLTSRIAARDVDPYLDTLYSAFEMVESGITTVQHLHGRVGPPLERMKGVADEVIRAYEAIGMRVSYSFGLRDQNRLVYEADEEFAKRLPPDVAAEFTDWVKGVAVPLEDSFALFEALRRGAEGKDRVRIQLAPVNLHWCSDRALERIKECSDKYAVPMHMHLVETAYQKEYARRRTGGTAAQHLYALGLLGPLMTLGHGVWLTEPDIELIAETGTHICTNASSNLRLRSGIAPLNRFERSGVRVALGLDEAGINDDRDMLQEMRLVLRLHRTPGMDDNVPTSPQVLRMATEHGAHTTPFGAMIGTIEPGRAADLVLVDWRQIAFPYLDRDVPVVDAVVQRARTSGVQTVVVGGEVILRDGKFTRIDKEEALKELAARLNVPLRPAEERRRKLAGALFPHVRQFYDGYCRHGHDHAPFYRPNASE